MSISVGPNPNVGKLWYDLLVEPIHKELENEGDSKLDDMGKLFLKTLLALLKYTGLRYQDKQDRSISWWQVLNYPFIVAIYAVTKELGDATQDQKLKNSLHMLQAQTDAYSTLDRNSIVLFLALVILPALGACILVFYAQRFVIRFATAIFYMVWAAVKYRLGE